MYRNRKAAAHAVTVCMKRAINCGNKDSLYFAIIYLHELLKLVQAVNPQEGAIEYVTFVVNSKLMENLKRARNALAHNPCIHASYFNKIAADLEGCEDTDFCDLCNMVCHLAGYKGNPKLFMEFYDCILEANFN